MEDSKSELRVNCTVAGGGGGGGRPTHQSRDFIPIRRNKSRIVQYSGIRTRDNERSESRIRRPTDSSTVLRAVRVCIRHCCVHRRDGNTGTGKQVVTVLSRQQGTSNRNAEETKCEIRCCQLENGANTHVCCWLLCLAWANGKMLCIAVTSCK
jgi:hypothetical protein